MGTHCITTIKDNSNNVYVSMYRHFDGYPSGHGTELYNFLDGMIVVNGFNDTTPHKSANGPGCLAAQLVAHFKTEIGQFYLVPIQQTEEFNYVVIVDETSNITIQVLNYETLIFEGDLPQFFKFIERSEG